jgi:hypothetical protein
VWFFPPDCRASALPRFRDRLGIILRNRGSAEGQKREIDHEANFVLWGMDRVDFSEFCVSAPPRFRDCTIGDPKTEIPRFRRGRLLR